MALEEDLVAAAGVVAAAEEMVQAHLVQVGDTRVGGDVPANADVFLLCTLHHNGCVPADPGAVLTLKFLIAGVSRLLVGGDSVNVVGIDNGGDLYTLLASFLQKRAQDVFGTFGAVSFNKVLKGLGPLLGFFSIDVFQSVEKSAQGVFVRFCVTQTNPTSLVFSCEGVTTAILRG